MHLNEYQTVSEGTSVYPGYGKFDGTGLLYTTIAMCGEAGEFANIVKKVMRDGGMTPEKRDKLILEAGDVLWYLARCAQELGVSLETVATLNLEKLKKRKEEGTLYASADGSR